MLWNALPRSRPHFFNNFVLIKKFFPSQVIGTDDFCQLSNIKSFDERKKNAMKGKFNVCWFDGWADKLFSKYNYIHIVIGWRLSLRIPKMSFKAMTFDAQIENSNDFVNNKNIQTNWKFEVYINTKRFLIG